MAAVLGFKFLGPWPGFVAAPLSLLTHWAAFLTYSAKLSLVYSKSSCIEDWENLIKTNCAEDGPMVAFVVGCLLLVDNILFFVVWFLQPKAVVAKGSETSY